MYHTSKKVLPFAFFFLLTKPAKGGKDSFLGEILLSDLTFWQKYKNLLKSYLKFHTYYKTFLNITFQILWTKKGTITLLLGLGNDSKGTKMPEAYFIISSIRNIIGQEGTFMDEKGTTL